MCDTLRRLQLEQCTSLGQRDPAPEVAAERDAEIGIERLLADRRDRSAHVDAAAAAVLRAYLGRPAAA